MDGGYERFPDFASWTGSVGDVTQRLVDQAVQRLRDTVRQLDRTAVELAAHQSLLLAALHTGAVEGVHQMSRGVTLTALDNALDWKRIIDDAEGTDARRQVEAALDSFDYAVDAARNDEPSPITEKWIREVHLAACSAQETVVVMTPQGRQAQPFVRGRYKQHPNHVLLRDGSIHHYCPPDLVGDEMQRFVDELRSRDFAQAHFVQRAAYAHHAFTWVHPFQDGNGRVARVIASVPLLRAASIPFHVYGDQVADYFAALSAADRGNPAPFVRFVSDRVLDLAQLTEDRLVAASTTFGPIDPALIDRASTVLRGAERLKQLVTQRVALAAADDDLPDHVRAHQSTMGSSDVKSDGFRTYETSHGSLVIEVPTLGLMEHVWFPIMTRPSSADEYEVRLACRADGRSLDFRLTDLYPEISTSAQHRVDAFVEREVKQALARISEQAAAPGERADGSGDAT